MLRTRLGASLALALLTCSAHAAIIGTVVSNAGAPVAGARVTAFVPETGEARRARFITRGERTPVATATTGAKGTFTLDVGKMPTVDVIAEAKGFVAGQRRAEAEDELVIGLLKARPKTGRVTAGGKPVAGAVVLPGLGSLSTTTDDAGNYTIPFGAYQLFVIHPDYAVFERRTSMLSEMKTDVSLDAGVAVTGRVVNADGTTPARGAKILVDGWPLAKSGDDGTFTVPHAPKSWRTIDVVAPGSFAAVTRESAPSPLVIRIRPAATVSGVVTDARTKLPIPGAEVFLGPRYDPGWTAITDAKGTYTFGNVRPGALTLGIVHPAYAVPAINVELTSGQKLNRPIAAMPLSRISGTVLDEEKQPVAGVMVTASRVVRDQGMSSDDYVVPVPVSPDGRFLLRARMEGEVRLDAGGKGLPMVHSTPFTIRPGEVKKAMTLVIPRGIQFTGRVVDNTGKPLSGVGVTADDGQGQLTYSSTPGAPDDDTLVRTGSDGTFAMRLKEGKYLFVFAREGFVTRSLMQQEVSASSKPLEVTMDPGVEISGRVTRSGTPIEAASVMVFGMNAPMRATTASDGSFTLRDLTSGPQRVSISKAEEQVSDTRMITAPARDVVIDLPEGGTIRGRVIDKDSGKALTDFRAGVFRGSGPIRFLGMLQAFTSDDGSFVLQHVTPGVYQVVAVAPDHARGRAGGITVENGKTVEGVEVALPPAARLTGRITGPDGSALSGAEVREYNAQAPPIGPLMPGDTGAVTDSEGEYSISTLEEGEKTFTIARRGYVTEQRTVRLSGRDNRLDVQLSTGMRVTGVVVTMSGSPVADADVRATSGAAAGTSRGGRTDSSGTFSIDGLAPGRYNFLVVKQGYANGGAKDIDIATAGLIRITLPAGATIYGAVRGATAEELKQMMVYAMNETSTATSQVDSSGQYRMESAPSGMVRVAVQSQRGEAVRSSALKTVEVPAGGSMQVDLDLGTDIVLRGRVTQDGVPAANASVMFYARGGFGGATRVSTDATGAYVASGLVDGPYRVTVGFDAPRRGSYTTNLQVSGSATFDINVRMSQIRGRVVDAGTGEPVGDARIQLRQKGIDTYYVGSAAMTDAKGAFVLESVASGAYLLSADKAGYGNDLRDVNVGDSTAEVELKLARADGITLRVVDGRDGRLLTASAFAFDAQNRQIGSGGAMMPTGVAEAVRLNLAPGQYRIMVGAPGYAPRSMVVSSPSQQTVTLTPGGSITIRTKSQTPLRARLLDAVGLPYFGETVFTIVAFYTRQNVAPGEYRLQLLDDNEVVKSTMTVSVREGETKVVDL